MFAMTTGQRRKYLVSISNETVTNDILYGLSLPSHLYTITKDECYVFHGGSMMFSDNMVPITNLNTYVAPTFMSTSLKQSIAMEFIRDTLYIIKLLTGSKVIPMALIAKKEQ